MTREQAKENIRNNWRTLLPSFTGIAKAPVNGERSYICPLCGHGNNGDGLTFDPKSSDKNTLKCFGCGKSGDVFDFYQAAKNVDFNTAFEALSRELGLDVEKSASRPNDKPRAPMKHGPEYLEACRAVLHDSQEALSYLAARGLSLETAEAFGLGYDPEWQNEKTFRERGFAYKSKRLIIPSGDSSYLARAIGEDKAPKQNFGETSIFNAAALYDDQEGPVFVTEGAIDALSFFEVGAQAIALNGAANTGLLIKALEKQPTKKTLLLALDNDPSGKENSEKLLKELKRLNVPSLPVKGVYPSGCKDANDALINNREEFKTAVDLMKGRGSSRPDNVLTYLDGQMVKDLQLFKAGLGVKTGIGAIDDHSKGLFAGFYILAAVPSLGKTTLASQIADNLAKDGHEVVYFSLEQSALEMITKSLARATARKDMKTAVSSLDIRCGVFPPSVKDALSEFTQSVGNRLSIVEGNFNCNVTYVEAYLRKYIQDTGVRPVVFIDYIQILEPAVEEQTRGTKEAVDSVVTSLKRLSRDLNLTIIAISSVNRSSYLVPISFESLKESGALEFTADVVWGLQLSCLTQDDEFKQEDNKIRKREIVQEAKIANPREVELVCLKNRFGKASYSGSLLYYPANDLFVDVEPEDDYTAFSFGSKGRR